MKGHGPSLLEPVRMEELSSVEMISSLPRPALEEVRLRGLLALIDRETLLLQRRLRLFQPETRVNGPRRS